VSILDGKVIMWTIDVGWDDTGEVASIFLGIGTVHGVNETLSICVSLVRWVGWSIVKHSLINRVGCFVRENARGKERNKLFDLVDSAIFHDIIVDESVFTVELDLIKKDEKKNL